jgi:hypothetical protein
MMNLFEHRSLRQIAPVLGMVIGFVLQANATLTRGPMLQGATSTNIWVLAECTTTAAVAVNFGTTTSYGSSATTSGTRASNAGSTYVHVIKLIGLQPNTVYHYQLVAQGTTSADYTFTTLVNPGTPFRFAWAADFRNGTAVHNQICDRIRTSHLSPRAPLFDLTGGDYAGDNTYANWTSQWLTANEVALEQVMPVYLAPGNHDGWASGSNMQAFDQPPDSSGANGYYSFDCGDLHVTMANYQYTYTSGSAQWNWIQQDVTNSLKAWKIFAFHAPAYTYGGSGTHGGDATMQSLSTSVLQPNGVKVFFAGHNHFYQRNLVSGIQHITCGGAGAPLYSVTNGTGTIVSVRDNCYMICDVNPTNLHMVAYNNAGTVLDTIDLYKPPAPTNVVATPGNAQAALTWNAVSGATSYTVYYGTANGGPYPSKTNSTVANATVTNLVNGTTYYFVVSATDANGPSGISAQVSAIPNIQTPQVTLTGPVNGAAYRAPATFGVGATVTANGNTINKVQFYSNTTNLLVEDFSPPYSWLWRNVAAGSYTIMARLVYNGSSTVDSTSATVTVTNPPPVPPVISSCGVLSNGSFSLAGTGAVGQTCILLRASNLASPTVWAPIATNTADISGAFSLSDPQATNYARRFYRTWTP